MKEARLLARAILIVDAEGIVRYTQAVEELNNHPDYDAALEAVKKLK